MSDPHFIEDDAARYVLGGLTGTDLREFEARLAQSVELRTLVYELEESTVALALASPPRQPLPQVWQRIEKIVVKEAYRKSVVPAFWTSWWRTGWAAAAACLASWLLYAIWVHRPGQANVSPVWSPEIHSRPRMATGDSTDSTQTKPSQIQQQVPARNQTTDQLLQARLKEIGGLRWQVAELENRMAHLSQSLTQQQALLSESNRFKFYQLAPASNGVGTTAGTLSVDLQRALFLAMARELGWLQLTDSTSRAQAGSVVFSSGPSNQLNLDFVDLQAASNSITNPFRSPPQMEAQITDGSIVSSPTSAAEGTIPAFVSGDKLVVAIDSTIAPSGSQLVFTSAGTGSQQLLGTTTLGDSPVVVTVPMGGLSTSGGTVSIGIGTAAGSSNIFQLHLPGSTPPP